ncbi:MULTISPECIES: hypothetical protein [Bartonella]|uniref:hypothetical protein n=1 Tax=Bartonella TaxID=773 RepID=UPI0023621C7D|nr:MULTISPECIES: hypothetical protein [Bartonella]
MLAICGWSDCFLYLSVTRQKSGKNRECKSVGAKGCVKNSVREWGLSVVSDEITSFDGISEGGGVG